ncbi:DMT family transporter [Jeotgalibacillus aurantiacus]|uniref:DMT family transporter n=1 Tax=Jeotgalibacillus aurantiacus TaxID=2763266 RepID=UPI001D0AF6AA|nr:EamA family transporter [Jeotgalibacillus aurantiacus]
MRPYFALAGLSLIWGLSFVFIKLLAESSGVWGTVFIRCTAGALILLPILWTQRKRLTTPVPWGHLVVIGLFNAAFPWALIALSETQIASNTASVLNALTPVCAGLIGFFLFKKKLNAKQWTGIATGFLGVLVLIEFNIGGLFSSEFVGVGTMVLGAMCYGFGSHYVMRFARNTGVVLLSTSSLITGAIISLAAMLVSGTSPAAFTFDQTFWIAAIGLGCFGSGIAYLLYYYLVKESSPEFATTVTYLAPVSAMIWGSVLLDEAVTPSLIAGMLIIFSGIYIANRKAKSRKGSAVEAA